MSIELPEIDVPLVAIDDDDPEYDAYAAFEVRAFAKKLSEFYVVAEKFDANLAAILFVLRRSPKFKEKLLRDFKHEDFKHWNSREVISDIQNGQSLARTITGTLAGFLELAKEYHPDLEQ